jgi:uncharacterized cupredoxin-like copper-binding protein
MPLGLASAQLTDSTHLAATASLDVAATGDYGYQPDTFQQVPTNATITVTFSDESDLPHTFTIIGKEGWVIPSSYTPTQIDELGYGNAPPALFNTNVSGSGDQNISTFQSPGPGWYEFVCTVPGHFQNGMYGFIAFGESLPSNLTAPSRQGIGGVTISPIQAVSAGAVLLALLLGYVVWRRRRPTHRMPPELVGHSTTISAGAHPPSRPPGAARERSRGARTRA